MSTASTKESSNFTPMYEAFADDTKAGLEEFNQALDEMGVDNIVEALVNIGSTGSSTVTYEPSWMGVSFQAYAYLSPSDFLQIWMEAITLEPDPVVHAVCRFSWNPQGHVATHALYVERIRHAQGRPHRQRMSTKDTTRRPPMDLSFPLFVFNAIDNVDQATVFYGDPEVVVTAMRLVSFQSTSAYMEISSSAIDSLTVLDAVQKMDDAMPTYVLFNDFDCAEADMQQSILDLLADHNHSRSVMIALAHGRPPSQEYLPHVAQIFYVENKYSCVAVPHEA